MKHIPNRQEIEGMIRKRMSVLSVLLAFVLLFVNNFGCTRNQDTV